MWAAVALMGAFELCVVFAPDKYSFVSTAWIFLSWNGAAMCRLAYIVAAPSRVRTAADECDAVLRLLAEAPPLAPASPTVGAEGGDSKPDAPPSSVSGSDVAGDAPSPRGLAGVAPGGKRHAIATRSKFVGGLLSGAAAVSTPDSAERQMRFRVVGWYACAFLSLLVFAIINSALADQYAADLGFGTLLCVVILDACAMILYRVRLIRSAWLLCVAFLGARACLMSFGQRWWLLGHALTYLVVGLIIGFVVIRRIVEAPSSLPARSATAPRWSVLLSQPYVALVLITVSFVIETLVARFAMAPGATVVLLSSAPHDQTDFCYFSLLCVGITMTAAYAWAAYVNDDRNLKSVRAISASAATWAGSIGGGFLLFVEGGSYIFLASAIFLPPIVGATAVGLDAWRANHYCLSAIYLQLHVPARWRPLMSSTLDVLWRQAKTAAGYAHALARRAAGGVAGSDGSQGDAAAAGVAVPPTPMAPQIVVVSDDGSPVVHDGEGGGDSGGSGGSGVATSGGGAQGGSGRRDATEAAQAASSAVHDVRVRGTRAASVGAGGLAPFEPEGGHDVVRQKEIADVTHNAHVFLACVAVVCGSLLGFGIMVTIGVPDPRWLGFSISAAILEVLCTAIGLVAVSRAPPPSSATWFSKALPEFAAPFAALPDLAQVVCVVGVLCHVAIHIALFAVVTSTEGYAARGLDML